MSRLDLKDWRKRFGIDQELLAKMLGVDRTTVARWEIGKHRIPAQVEAALTVAADRCSYGVAVAAQMVRESNDSPSQLLAFLGCGRASVTVDWTTDDPKAWRRSVDLAEECHKANRRKP